MFKQISKNDYYLGNTENINCNNSNNSSSNNNSSTFNMKQNLLSSKIQIGDSNMKPEFITTFKQDYTIHSLSNNSYNTKKLKHLIPNISTVSLHGEVDKKPYLTSFKRDYYSKPIKENRLNSELRSLIKISKIELGTDKKCFDTNYNKDYINPSLQVSKYDFNNVKFKQRDFSIHPINTSDNVKNIWSYEHIDYNGKNHNKRSSNIPQIIHNNYYYSFDNITNRYIK